MARLREERIKRFIEAPVTGGTPGALEDKFWHPPFSVFQTTGTDWVKNRNKWLQIGVEGGEGRPDSLTYTMKNATTISNYGSMANTIMTSVFDPFLCELVYRWWSPASGLVLDPFCGGSTRGLVAGIMGRSYTGIDIRSEQILANLSQLEKVKKENPRLGIIRPNWILGDSAKILSGLPDNEYDLVFSCPPYGDLETYSDIPGDLSNMTYEDFLIFYADIIRQSIQKLRENRFAVFVVGNFRDKEKYLHNLVGDSVRAFELAGCRFYSEGNLYKIGASSGMRAAAQFTNGRRLISVHQNVLVFVKGDWRKAVKDLIG